MHTGVAQAQQRARPGAARQAHGQAADHRRDRRRPARRRQRDGVRAARPRVHRLHGRGGHRAASSPTSSAWSCSARASCRSRPGARTLKEAISEAIRDWVTNVATTHYIIGSAVGPAPYPAIVRDLQRVIGDEARAQLLERDGPAARPRRRLRRRRLERDRHVRRASSTTPSVELVGVEAGGRGPRHRPPRRAADRRRPRRACCTARCSAVLQDDEGRSSRRTRSPPASTTRASGPEHAWLRDSGRARYVAVTDDEALRRVPRASRGSRGSSRRSSPPTRSHWALASRPTASSTSSACSGRGDKDLAEVARAP